MVALRRVLKEVEERPQLPPKLQLKFLDVPTPRVEIGGEGKSGGKVRGLEEMALPPKRRIRKRGGGNGEGGGGDGEGGRVVRKGRRGVKWVDGESLERRKQHICQLASELGGVARQFNESGMVGRLARVEKSLGGERDVSGTYIQRSRGVVEGGFIVSSRCGGGDRF